MNFNIRLICTFFVMSFFIFACGGPQQPPAKPATTTTTTKPEPQKKLTKEQQFANAIDKDSALKQALAKAIQENPMVLFAKFNLNKEQSDAVSKSLEVNDISKISGLPNARSNPKFKAFEKEVRAVLNPKQTKQFEDLLSKMN